MSVPDSHLIGEGAAPSVEAHDQETSVPLYTYLMNAGLSITDVRQVGDELWRRVKEQIAKLAASDDADMRRRYTEGAKPGSTLEQIARGRRYRSEVNKEVIANELAKMMFNRSEMRRIDQGTGLGLAGERPNAGKKIARVTMPGLPPQKFEVVAEPIEGVSDKTVLRDMQTGEVVSI